MVLTYAVALSLGLILDVVQKPWRQFKKRILLASEVSIDALEASVSRQFSPRDRRPAHSRSALSGSPRGNILPLARLNGKGCESSDGVV
jgi:hypothetical protein